MQTEFMRVQEASDFIRANMLTHNFPYISEVSNDISFRHMSLIQNTPRVRIDFISDLEVVMDRKFAFYDDKRIALVYLTLLNYPEIFGKMPKIALETDIERYGMIKSFSLYYYNKETLFNGEMIFGLMYLIASEIGGSRAIDIFNSIEPIYFRPLNKEKMMKILNASKEDGELKAFLLRYIHDNYEIDSSFRL